MRDLERDTGSVDTCRRALATRCDDPHVISLLDEFLAEATQRGLGYQGWNDSEIGRRIRDLDDASTVKLVLGAFARCYGYQHHPAAEVLPRRMSNLLTIHFASELINSKLRLVLPFSQNDLAALAQCLSSNSWFSFKLYFNVIARELRGEKLGAELRDALEGLRSRLCSKFVPRVIEESVRAIDVILGDVPTQVRKLILLPGEAWSDMAIADLARMFPDQRARWNDLLVYAQASKGSRPSNKWLTGAKENIEKIGVEEFKRHFLSWIELVDKPRTQTEASGGRFQPDANLLIAEPNANLLKGLAWACSWMGDARVARSIGDLAIACYKKVKWHGPRCIKTANAAVVALSSMEGKEAAAQLGRLAAQVKHPSCRKFATKGLERFAERNGQAAEDLEELAVPTFGLSSDGSINREIGEFQAEVRVTQKGVDFSFLGANGKPQKSIPAQVKQDHLESVNELKRTVKDIQKLLPAQRVRIERLLLNKRQWNYTDWRERYAEQPLVSNFARRLIWQFNLEGKPQTGIFHDGVIVDSENKPLDLPADARVQLWHPLFSPAETVLNWRNWLEKHEVTQPFKQAHREVYVLTDAERATSTYSNRFAAHILRQHQFASLAQSRGWTYRLQGQFDSHNFPTLVLPQHALRVEFWVDPGNGQTSPAGIFLHVLTDQVRFFRTGQTEPARLEEIPPLLFSEIMRDVDLFVGVASVGNDPNWQDLGETRFNTYWHDYSFGDLNESAKTRFAVLERLIPRLKIASKCSLDGRFLLVRGQLRNYKIHLGSGNILMEPNDQYLCIVRSRSVDDSKSNLFLPFEGDATLSIIISKAFLLVNDTKITDESIKSQINRPPT